MNTAKEKTKILLYLCIGILLGGCGAGDSEEVALTPTEHSPTITINGNNSIQEGQELSLTANAFDTDGTISAINWSVITGEDIILNGANTENVNFIAPDVDVDTDIALTVRVVDNDGLTTTQNFIITILRKVNSVTITGLVTDSVINNARVEVNIGEEVFSTTADENGVYTITLDSDELLLSQLIELKAIGHEDINPEVEFISQLGSLSSLIEQAGNDGILTKDEDFGVNITNVTTAEYALITRDGDIPTTDDELLEAINGLDIDEKNTLAALIKIVVDNVDFSLPNGVTSTLDLVDDSVTANDFEQEITTQNPTLITETINTIVNDNTLTGETSIVGSWKIGSEVITFSRSGHYVHITTEAQQGSNEKIGYEVGSYTWNEDTGSLTYTTTEDSNSDSGLHNEFDEPLNTQITHVGAFIVTGDTLIIDEGDESFNGTRLTSTTNPLVGGFYLERTNFSDDLSMRITLDDNTFVVILKSDSSALPVGTSYLYLMREYSYEAQSSVHTRLSQKVYVDGNVISENTDAIDSLVDIQGDVIAFTGENTTSFIKNSYTTTTQAYLTEDTLIGDFKGIIDDSFTFNTAFNIDGTGEVSSQEGDSSLEWKVVFGQLLLTFEDGSLQVWSPTNLDDENNRVFNVKQYDGGILEENSGGTLSPLNSAIVGTWTSSDVMFSLTFTNDGRYVHMQEEDSSDNCDSTGYEVGTYLWNEFTGSVTVTTTEDTNGCFGLHDEESLGAPFEIEATIQIVNGNMVFTELSSNEVSIFTRIISDTNPIVGAYYEGDFDNDFYLMVIEENGNYMELAHDSSELGISAGTYSWSADTNLFDITSTTIDQANVNLGSFIASIQGDILRWADYNVGDGGLMKRTHQSTDQPYLQDVNQIIGDFTGNTNEGSALQISFNDNFTGISTDNTGTYSFGWSLEFGQLILNYSDVAKDETMILSPTAISLNTLEFSVVSFDFTIGNNGEGQTTYYDSIWTRD